MTDRDPNRIDSRRWTGRGLGTTRLERRRAWAAFRAAAGPEAAAPRRAAALTCALGVLPAALALCLAAGRPDGLRAALARQAGPNFTRWLEASIGPALAVALAAALAGTLSARRHRGALAHGFAAAPAQHLERGGADVAIGLAAFGWLTAATTSTPVHGILLLWVMAYLLSRGMTLLAERLAAVPDGRARAAATLAAAMGAAAVLLVLSLRR